MARTRFLRTDNTSIDCTAAINTDSTIESTQTAGNETVTAEIGPQDMYNLGARGNHEFTTVDGDPGGDEDLPASSVFSCVIDVTVADSPMTYIVDLFMADDIGCAVIGSGVRMTESAFSGTGLKTANFTWDPPAGDRWNIRVGGIGNGMMSDPTSTLTLRGNNSTVVFTAPDAPSAGNQPVIPMLIVRDFSDSDNTFNTRPFFFPLVMPSTAAPAVARPVPPILVTPYHFSVPKPEAFPQFFPTFVREPSFPVLPFNVVEYPHDIPKLQEALPRYINFPWISTVVAQANPVPPLFVTPFHFEQPLLDEAVPKYLPYPWFTTFPRPVIPFKVVPYHFDVLDLDAAAPKYFVWIGPSTAAPSAATPFIPFLAMPVAWDEPAVDHPYMKPRFFPTVMFFTDWQDYESFLQYDDTKYGGSQLIFFEANLTDTGTGPVRARLFNITDSVPVPGSTVQTTSSTTVRLRSGDLAAVVSGTRDYKAQIGLKRGQTGDMSAARIIVEQ